MMLFTNSINFHSNLNYQNKSLNNNNLNKSQQNEQHTKHDNSLH
jgi:hypothetical protein